MQNLYQTYQSLNILSCYLPDILKSHIEYEEYHRNGRMWTRKRNKSDKTPVYNTPIHASKDFQGVKEAKQKIKEDGYKEEDVERFLNKIMTDEFVNKIKKQINHNTVFLAMPSTSGQNKIPLRLAQKLSKKLGIKVINPGITSANLHEAKKLRGVDKLTYQPRFLVSLDDELELNKFKNSDIFLVDDIFTTGMSVNNAAVMLEDNGYHVPQIISISSASSSFTAESDINKMVELAHINLGIPRDLAKKKLDELSKVSSTIGHQFYQDLSAKTEATKQKYKNWFYS